MADKPPKPTWQTHACFGRNCAKWAAGAPHKCEIGRCDKYEKALEAWERLYGAMIGEDGSDLT